MKPIPSDHHHATTFTCDCTGAKHKLYTRTSMKAKPITYYEMCYKCGFQWHHYLYWCDSWLLVREYPKHKEIDES